MNKHDEILSRVKLYLHKKATEVVKAGTNVILDFGFWSSKERKKVSDFYTSMNVSFEWHYIDISDDDWTKNIKERNNLIKEGLSKDYYFDDGLMSKLTSLFEEPSKQEMTVWYFNRRV